MIILQVAQESNSSFSDLIFSSSLNWNVRFAHSCNFRKSQVYTICAINTWAFLNAIFESLQPKVIIIIKSKYGNLPSIHAMTYKVYINYRQARFKNLFMDHGCFQSYVKMNYFAGYKNLTGFKLQARDCPLYELAFMGKNKAFRAPC